MNLNQNKIEIGQRWKRNDTGRTKTVLEISEMGLVTLGASNRLNTISGSVLRSNYTLLD